VQNIQGKRGLKHFVKFTTMLGFWNFTKRSKQRSPRCTGVCQSVDREVTSLTFLYERLTVIRLRARVWAQASLLMCLDLLIVSLMMSP